MAAEVGIDYATLKTVIVNEIVSMCRWHRYALVEAIYVFSLTPSSIEWRRGVRYVINTKNNGLNFLTNFIQETVFKYGAV